MTAAILEPIVGVRGRSFLRRVVANGGNLVASWHGDLHIARQLVTAGMLDADQRDANTFRITGKGAAFLKRLNQAH